MISEIEISPTNRATCSVCSAKIDKGKLRGKVYNGRFNNYNYLCGSCAYKQVLEDIDKLIKMKQELEILEKAY